MHKVMSTEQLAANRRNAQKSTGPRTPDGKARAARNNTRHGFFSSDLVLSTGHLAEDCSEFEALRAAYHADLRPADLTEWRCVETIIRCLWLARRALRYETTLLPGETPDPEGLHYFKRPSFPAFVRFESRLHRTLFHVFQCLEFHRQDPFRPFLEALTAPATPHPSHKQKNSKSNSSSTQTSKFTDSRAGRIAKPLAMIRGSKATRFAERTVDPAK